MLSANDTLSAQDLIAEETNQAYGKDLNADKAVGLKIDQAIDKKAGLYSATVLGQNYYFFDAVNKKTGTTLGSSIDLSHAFYDANAKAWAPPVNAADEGPTQIAGLVKNVSTDGDVIGYDIYTYNQKTVSGDFNVQKHSWTWSANNGLVFKGSGAADAAELVQVEKDNQRDLSGDGFVGFKLVGRSDVNDKYEGVTKATVFGNDSYFIVGKNLKPGTPSTPWKLSDALLSQDGSGAWSIPDINVNDVDLKKMITAVRDIANSNNRFVYVKYSSADETQSNFIQKYKFDKSTGKYTGDSEKLDDIALAAEEINNKRDLNNDGKLGVFSFSDVKLSTESAGSGPTYEGIFSGQGKSSGLIRTTINNVDYLVVKKLPNSNSLMNLDLALVDADGKAWKPADTFQLKGIYKNSSTNETEIYGYENLNQNPSSISLKKYQFSLTDVPTSADAVEASQNGIVPKVLKLKSGDDAGPALVSDLKVMERENAVGKDLNNDSTIGIKLNETNIASIPTGTSLGSATVGSGNSGNSTTKVYVVGKSLSAMGATAIKTANQNALRAVNAATGNLDYWAPDSSDEVIKSITESTNAIKVYTQLNQNISEYSFVKDDSGDTPGWTLDSASVSINSKQLADLETSSYRDLNTDGFIGLKYGDAATIDGTYNGTINGSTYYFAGSASKGIVNGTAPFGIDMTKLLKDENGDPLTGLSGNFSVLSTGADNGPDGTAFVLSQTGQNSKIYLNSEYQKIGEAS
jgi:hypothetical protein